MRAVVFAAAVAMAATSTATSARSDNDSAAEAQAQLRRGGYTLVSTDADGRRQWRYWWNPKRHDCRLLTLDRDRLASSVLTSETDCGQWRESSRTSDPGRTAIAAAKLLRVDSLLHRSHERNIKQYDQVGEVAHFERGYRDGRDGRDGRRGDARSGGRAYADGYGAGERKRDTTVRPPVVPPGGGGVFPPGVRPVQPVSRPHDLAGRSTREFEPAMQAMGYQRWSSGSTQSGDVVSVWRGPNSPSECVRVWVRGALVQQILDANEDECRVAKSR